MLNKKYLDRTIFYLFLISCPITALSVSRYFFSGWELVYFRDIFLTLWLATLYYTASPYNVKALSLIFIFNSISVGNIYAYQMWGTGGIGFLIATIFCWLFFNRKYAILNMIAIALFGFYYFNWVASFPLQLDRTLTPIDVALQFAALFFLLYPCIDFLDEIKAERKTADNELKDQLERVKRAEAAKTNFLANMSHEMRTPLNAILGGIELLDSTSLKKQQQEFIRVSQTAGKSLKRVIDDVLDMARIEAGGVRIKPNWFISTALIDDVVSLFTHDARQAETSIEANIDPDVPRWLYGDTGRIKQVLFNLMSNAIKFTEQGKVTASLQCLEADNTFRFTVTDTGIGIPKAIGDNVFEAFSQVDSSLVRKQQGSGLGLAISKHLVFAMKGKINYQSKPNEGTSFWFDLHLDSAQHRESPINAKASEAPETFFEALPEDAYRLLLAEDSTANSFILRTYLETVGHEVDLASNGLEALALAQKFSYDAILMDLSMPEMDGLEATKILRAKEGVNRDTPIIALTAHVLKEIREQCVEAGMTNFLTKPVSKEKLLETLDHSVAAGQHDLRF